MEIPPFNFFLIYQLCCTDYSCLLYHSKFRPLCPSIVCVRPTIQWYDTKQSDGEAPVMLELWGMLSTSSFLSFSGSLWPVVVALDRILFMSQIELNSVLMLNWIVWNRTVYKYKNGFGINNLQWLMYHKTKPN